LKLMKPQGLISQMFVIENVSDIWSQALPP